MKTLFFRWAIGLLSILGAALTAMPVTVEAAATRGVGVTLFARNDVGPLIGVALVDSTGQDRADGCTRGAQVNPDYDDWSCLALPDDRYELRVTAPLDISVEIRCHFASGSMFERQATRLVELPQASGFASCIVWAWPTADTYPPAALAFVHAMAPASLLATTTLALTDSGGATVGGCTQYPEDDSVVCEPLATGSYRATLAGAPAGLRVSLSCTTTSSDPYEPFGWHDTDEIVISPGTLRVDCWLIAATPTIEITATGINSNTHMSLAPHGGGPSVECTRADNVFTCQTLAPGTYDLVTDAPLPLGLPMAWGCSDWGPARTVLSGWPASFTVPDDADVVWFTCSFDTGAAVPPTTAITPTTIGGPHDSGAPSDTTGSEGPVPTSTIAPRGLPSTGGSAPLLPAALVLLALGAGASMLARRPVR